MSGDDVVLQKKITFSNDTINDVNDGGLTFAIIVGVVTGNDVTDSKSVSSCKSPPHVNNNCSLHCNMSSTLPKMASICVGDNNFSRSIVAHTTSINMVSLAIYVCSVATNSLNMSRCCRVNRCLQRRRRCLRTVGGSSNDRINGDEPDSVLKWYQYME